MWAVTGEPAAVPLTTAAGVLVDVDHILDVWWTFGLRRRPITTLLLHAWEWLAALVLLGAWSGFPWWLLAMTIGYSLHVVTDLIFNEGHPWTYSLIYRARYGFHATRLNPEWSFDHAYAQLQREARPAIMLIEWWKGSPVIDGRNTPYGR